jgi:hypothetical protein
MKRLINLLVFNLYLLQQNLIQLTFHRTGVDGNIRWHPNGKSLFYIWNGSIN